MRLFDAAMKHGIIYAPSDELEEPARKLAESIMEDVVEATCVDVSNVAEYVNQWGSRSVGFSTADGLTPPWPIMWLEWGDRPTGERYALYVKTDEASFDVQQGLAQPGCKWVVSVASFLDGSVFNSKLPVGPVIMSAYWLDAEGRLLPVKSGLFFANIHSAFTVALSADELRESYDHSLAIALFTSQFANCRNVDRVEILPSRQQRRSAERRGEPWRSHYVLEINPNRSQKVYPEQAGIGSPPAKRLHICRGHFATYSEDRPLFGKYSGRFWVPAHVRGNADVGEIDKDYRILPATD